MSNLVTVANIDIDTGVEELADFDTNDVVDIDDGGSGVVLEKKTSNFLWPDSEGEEVEASEENPVYIVAQSDGGSKPYAEDELSSTTREEAFGEIDIDEPAEKLKDDAEAARVYYLADNPRDIEEFRAAKERIRSRIAELLDVPAVDDPEVGFSSWPPSWEKAEKPARLILLDAWLSMGGTWTAAYNELGSKRLASAMKDEVYGTEDWRGGFGM